MCLACHLMENPECYGFIKSHYPMWMMKMGFVSPFSGLIIINSHDLLLKSLRPIVTNNRGLGLSW